MKDSVVPPRWRAASRAASAVMAAAATATGVALALGAPAISPVAAPVPVVASVQGAAVGEQTANLHVQPQTVVDRRGPGRHRQ